MSLVKIAKDKADAARNVENEAQVMKARAEQAIISKLVLLKNKTLDAIEEFNGVECKDGKLVVVLITPESYAINLILNGSRPTPVVEIKIAIHSGTFDGSDDCRDILYTEAAVTFSKPDNAKAMGWFYEYCSSESQLEHSLKKMAEYLSPLF